MTIPWIVASLVSGNTERKGSSVITPPMTDMSYPNSQKAHVAMLAMANCKPEAGEAEGVGVWCELQIEEPHLENLLQIIVKGSKARHWRLMLFCWQLRTQQSCCIDKRQSVKGEGASTCSVWTLYGSISPASRSASSTTGHPRAKLQEWGPPQIARAGCHSPMFEASIPVMFEVRCRRHG